MVHTSAEIFKRWMEPDFKFYVNREGSIEERKKFLMSNGRMKDEYLGACLNYCRWGGQTSVMYEMGTPGMIEFIQHWMKLNKDNLVWNDKPIPSNLFLPYKNIYHEGCPRSKEHNNYKRKPKRTIMDCFGVLRCAHLSMEHYKPNYTRKFKSFDDFSQQDRIEFIVDEPENCLPDDAYDKDGKLNETYREESEKYERESAEFESEEPTLDVHNLCYAILDKKEGILSLETVLDRLNEEPRRENNYCSIGQSCRRLDELDESDREQASFSGFCPGHYDENDKTIHPFDGWTLAHYIQKWYEQIMVTGAPVFEKVKQTA